MIHLPAARRVAFLLLLTLAVRLQADVRVYVQFAPNQKAAAQAAIAQAQGREHHAFDNLNAIAVTLPDAARAALERNPAIALIEEDPVRGFLAQSVPYGIPMVQAPEARAAGGTGAGIKLGVIDSGVYAGHEDFAGVTITGEPDFGANDQRTWYRDYLSHGTHVVGTIAAANNLLGVDSVTGGGVSIHMVKVFGDLGQWVYSSDLLAAARAAHAKGVRIISMSLGGSTSSVTENNGMQDLYNKGVLIVAAAGNAGTNATSYPAGYASVISVAAIDAAKNVASFSQKNSDVELAAPGVAVQSTVSYIETNFVTAAAVNYPATHIEFSARGTIDGTLVYGGLGTATNAAWSGKIVLLDRGTNSFYQKVRNVQLSGGLGCIIANNEAGVLLATLGDGNSSTIPAIGVTQSDGASLKLSAGTNVTLNTQVQNSVNGYDFFDGTSMATPHVAGVAALVWSKFPGATNAQVRQALTSSAQDLGTPGRDNSYGFGLVQANAALAALEALNPGSGNSDTTAPSITNLLATVTNAKNGSFEITWTTNEPATSDVQLNGTLYADAALVTNHKRSFRGTKNAVYTYTVTSKDAAGNATTSAPASFTLK